MFLLSSIHFILDVESVSSNGRRSTVRIPYSSVPRMDYASSVYAKALATLAKQVHKDHDSVPCPKSSTDDAMDIGMYQFPPLNQLSLFNNPFLFVLDKPVTPLLTTDASIKPLSSVDFGIIRRARNTVSNSVIVDLAEEDPSSEDAYRNSLRRQILDGCASLRVNLIAIDHLMEYFNKSVAESSKSSSTTSKSASV